MLNRLLRWWQERRQWHQEHVRSWAGATEPDSTGFSPFQQALEPALVDLLRAHGLAVEGRELLPCDDHQMVHGYFADRHWEFWVYPDGADALCGCNHQVRYEEWGTRSPAEFVQLFTDDLRNELSAHLP